MMSGQENASANRQVQDLSPIELPSPRDVEALRELVAHMPADFRQRAGAAIEQGLLKDLAAHFEQQPGRSAKGIAHRRIADLGRMFEQFEAVAELLGYQPDPIEPARESLLELRVRDCLIEKCDLSNREVRWPVQLEHCTWTAPGVFVGTHFHGDASFLGAAFLGDANFFAASFDGHAFFGGATFHGAADFRGATFSRDINFFRANFKESLELRYCTFEDPVVLNLHEARFGGSSAFGGHLNLECDQLRRPGRLRNSGRIAGESSPDIRDLRHACQQYGELEANFAAQGSPDAAAARDWCHYRYMDLHRQTRYARWNPRRWLNWLFLKWGFGYGIYTKRVLISGLAAILLFGILYATNCFGLPHDLWSVQYGSAAERNLLAEQAWWQNLANGLYFSVITFATVGYGDWHPVHWARLAAALEGLLGVFVMAVFTVSFARKIIR